MGAWCSDGPVVHRRWLGVALGSRPQSRTTIAGPAASGGCRFVELPRRKRIWPFCLDHTDVGPGHSKSSSEGRARPLRHLDSVAAPVPHSETETVMIERPHVPS